ncbi:hypothetical protein KC342_g17118 [Hortaea werneckii]|nr:hypothetical protein KC342_g17118 [Hortaea werneckii]
MERLHSTVQAVSNNLKRAQPRPYKYIALEPDEIRLLCIHPINGETYWEKREDDPIRCSVWYCPRIGSPAYQALSYTWGGQERIHPVHVGDGTVLLVTKNCLDALRLLRQRNNLVVWIDAVCIDQSNADEKATQVAKIGDVFRNATRTLTYTGSDAGDGAEIAVCVGPSHSRSLVPSAMRKWLKGYESEESAGSWGKTCSTFDSKMAQRPWFRWTWVVQELMLSRRPVIMAKNGMFPLSSCADILCGVEGGPSVVDLYVELSHEYGKTPQPASGFGVCWPPEFRSEGRGEDAEGAKEPSQLALNLWRLPETLLRTCKFGCADPRDKVFAILPLFARPIPDLLQPDYAKTVEDGFIDTSWFMISYDSTALLALAADRLGPKTLPSWVADWRGPRRRLDFHSDCNGKLLETPWHAGYTDYKQCSARRLGQRSLYLRGVLVDRVAELTPELVSKPCWEARRIRRPSQLEVERCWQSIYGWEHDSENLGPDQSSPYQPARQSQTIARLVTHDHAAKFIVAIAPRIPFATRPYDFSRPAEHLPLSTADLPRAQSGRTTPLELAIARCDNRRLFRSVNFHLSGLGPAEAQPGDALCVFLGYDIPFLMRETPHGWRLLGECLVAGIMEGEVVKDLDWARVMEGEVIEPLQDFHMHLRSREGNATMVSTPKGKFVASRPPLNGLKASRASEVRRTLPFHRHYPSNRYGFISESFIEAWTS